MRRRSGFESASIATIRPPVTVKPMTENGRPPGATTTPAAPLTSAGRTNGDRREKVIARLKEKGIPSNIYYPVPLHLQPAYVSYGGKKGDFPHTEYAAEHILALPMHSEMTSEDIAYIATNVISAVQEFAQ